MNRRSLGKARNAGGATPPARPQVAAPVPSKQTVAIARRRAAWLLQRRRERDSMFPDVQFSDPSWDILLDLFIHQTDGRLVSVSSACIGSGCPVTTSLRHVTALVQSGVLRRWNSGQDARVSYVRLHETDYNNLAHLLARGEYV
jgi:hypothetical protein